MINQMIDINQRKICAYRENCTIPTWSLDPDITNRLATSRDYEELEYIWTAWRQNAAQIRPIYQQFVALSNKGARQGILYVIIVCHRFVL
jgi:peptidyl-dipeptidase A